MASLGEVLRGLGDDAATEISAAYEVLAAGDITRDIFDALLATIMQKYNIRAGVAGEVSLYVEYQLGDIPGGADPAKTYGDRAAVDRSVKKNTGVAQELLLAAALAMVTHSIYARGQYGRSRAISEAPEVIGWTRDLSPGACPLCVDWRRGGDMFDANLKMLHHPGCSCTQKPVAEDS